MRTQFQVHTLNDVGKQKAEYIARAFDNLAGDLESVCGELNTSRQMSLVATKLEEACFHAKKAMASDPQNHQ